MTVILRCTAPHPEVSGWTCRGKLADVVEGSVQVSIGVEPQPGCVAIACHRCGTDYILCPVQKAS